ncbi:MAG: DNA adenine methylase [Deltaproteobacteria bacterium]|nr:DNA adenine methylase [Deltaproteobacteria bacterium]
MTPAVAPSADVAPVLKWAGGKSRLLPELVSRLPSPRQWTGVYHEPFLGGGALFLHLRPARANLADANPELVNLYEVIRDDVEALIADLGRHTHERTYYYAVRALDAAGLGRVERASRFVFLNRTCFNGLYRVNRRGQFNVPFGRYDNPNLCPAERLRAVSRVLAGADLAHRDFEDAVAGARRGDFAYFDPPYVPLTRTASFTSYTAGDFGEDDQRRLAATVRRLARRGVRCMVSNSDAPLVHELYEGLRIERILAPRAISRAADSRKPVSELVIRTY